LAFVHLRIILFGLWTINNNFMLILLVAEYPFGTYNILLWSFNQRPHFITLEVVQFLLHSHHPIRIT
jgi:hypothetical protein